MHPVFAGVPLPSAAPSGCYDAGRGSCLLRWDGAAAADFTAACAALEQAGFALQGETVLEENHHRTYAAGVTVHIYYCAAEGVLRLIGDPSTACGPAAPDPTRICAPALWQFEVDHALIDCGMCYILRAGNGHFFVIDSPHGYSIRDDERICDFLRAQTGGETPVVEGWFFSHGHDDHITQFLDIVEYRLPQIEIRAVYYNFPPADHRDSAAWCPASSHVAARFERVLDAHPEIQRIRLHTGQRFYIVDLRVTVLCTHEDVFPASLENYNDTSTALLVEAAGSRILFPGDCAAESDRVLCGRYSEQTLRCDVLQISHHGHAGLSPEFYRRAAAPCCLFPVTRIKFDEELPRQAANRTAIALSREYYIASDGTVRIPLPYVCGRVERLPDETFENFSGIYQLWTYTYSQLYKDLLYLTYLSRGGRALPQPPALPAPQTEK
ncbi:MAG: hypothetical protein IK080_08335 [Clostridia bacterium]|nr:hypothetical protein [Clostridia bacterium]